MKCVRAIMHECTKDATHKVKIYLLKKIGHRKPERDGLLTTINVCEDHVKPFLKDPVNYEIQRLQK